MYFAACMTYPPMGHARSKPLLSPRGRAQRSPVGAAVGIPKRDERWRHEHFRHTLAKCKRLVDG